MAESEESELPASLLTKRMARAAENMGAARAGRSLGRREVSRLEGSGPRAFQ
jgi:hypothetical protein